MSGRDFRFRLCAAATAGCLLAGAAGGAEVRRKVPKSFGHNEIVVAMNAALKAQIRRCWNASPRAMREDRDFHIVVELRPDGSVRAASVLGPASLANDPGRRAVAQSARSALLGTWCNPLALPDELIGRDARVTLTINPAAVFAE